MTIVYVGRKKSIENYFDKKTIKWFPVNHTSAFLGHNKSTTQTVWFENSFSVNILLIRSVITCYVIFFFQVEISCLCIHFTYFLHSLNTQHFCSIRFNCKSVNYLQSRCICFGFFSAFLSLIEAIAWEYIKINCCMALF